jgi:hypothetical protein
MRATSGALGYPLCRGDEQPRDKKSAADHRDRDDVKPNSDDLESKSCVFSFVIGLRNRDVKGVTLRKNQDSEVARLYER